MRCQALTIRLVLVFAGAFTFAVLASAQSQQTVIYTFEDQSDGRPASSLVADAAGNLYGAAHGTEEPFGMIYELSPPSPPGGTWTFTILYAFQGGSDGADAEGPLVFDSAGNLYGVTVGGGSPSCPVGCGTIFELSPPSQPGGVWTESQLYAFQGSPNDGAYPAFGVVFSSQGNLYGTTTESGSGTCFGDGCGTVFQLTPSANGSWTETVIHNFVGGTDGYLPFAGVTPDRDGNLYGTTEDGGSEKICPATNRPGCGTIFILKAPSQPGGAWTEEVYTFPSNGTRFNRAGMNPEGGLTILNGAIYGTTFNGGNQGFGTIFKVSRANGKFTGAVLHNFNDGDYTYTHPAATMVADSAGNLYGTTGTGGCAYCDGTVFRLSPPHKPGAPWNFADIGGFTDDNQGGGPLGGVVIVKEALYGTTLVGGDLNCNEGVGCGVVYSISAQ